MKAEKGFHQCLEKLGVSCNMECIQLCEGVHEWVAMCTILVGFCCKEYLSLKSAFLSLSEKHTSVMVYMK